ncbi:MAG: (Fe-S)-binding protein [Planctomycetota bacterium]
MVCPVFAETLDEKYVARARIGLAEAWLKGALERSAELSGLWKTCIKCSRCTWVCPSGAKGDDVSMALAKAFQPQNKLSALKGFFRTVVMNRKAFDTFIGFAEAGSRLLRKNREGVLRHLPLAILGKTTMPVLGARSALRSLPSTAGVNAPVERVAFFVGCATNYVYPATAEAIVKILNRIGMEVVVPKGQLCCGTPALAVGATQEGAELARRNSEIFASLDVDAIVTGCASCALTLKRHYPEIAAKKLPPVFEFTQYLVAKGYSPGRRSKSEVAWHDPCHLRFGLGESKAPRDILRSSAVLLFMPDEDRCCGGGGTFAAFNPELSMKLVQRKIDGALVAGAETVLTGCPGCVMQLREHFADGAPGVKVEHIADFLLRECEL